MKILKITSEKSKTDITYYRIVREKLWEKQETDVNTKKYLTDFIGYGPIAMCFRLQMRYF